MKRTSYVSLFENIDPIFEKKKKITNGKISKTTKCTANAYQYLQRENQHTELNLYISFFWFGLATAARPQLIVPSGIRVSKWL